MHSKEDFSDGCCHKIRSEEIVYSFYHNSLKCFVGTGCYVSWHAVQNALWWYWMHFMTWFWQLLGHPFHSWTCVRSFPLHLEARHTLQNVEVPSHTPLRHICPIVFSCPSGDAKVKWIYSNKASNIHVSTFIVTYQLQILYICYWCWLLFMYGCNLLIVLWTDRFREIITTPYTISEFWILHLDLWSVSMSKSISRKKLPFIMHLRRLLAYIDCERYLTWNTCPCEKMQKESQPASIVCPMNTLKYHFSLWKQHCYFSFVMLEMLKLQKWHFVFSGVWMVCCEKPLKCIGSFTSWG